MLHAFALICVIYGWFGYITDLRKLEKAAMVAFIEMPMSATAKLNTRKLLGVLSSLTLRKAAMVTAFKRMPSRPCGWETGINNRAWRKYARR